MCRVVVWAAAAFAAGLACCGVEAAFAESRSDDHAAARLLFFSGVDFWRNGAFAHGGFLWAYQGLDADGLVFKLLLNGGVYRYRSGTTEIAGRQLMAAALPGWRWRRDGLEVTVFAGVDVQDHRYVPDDHGSRLRGTRVGARGGFDVWSEPLPDGMVTASASISTIGNGYWTRAAAGWRAFDMWLGPELHACGDDSYRQFRFGAHVTSLRMGSTEWSAGAGWVTDSDRRSGMYGRVGLLMRR